MATEYKLSYTAEEIDAKLGKIDELEEKLNNIEDEATDTTDTTKGVEIGTIVRIDDVSATEHEMDVSISGVDKPTAVQVIRHGKNATATVFNNKEVVGDSQNNWVDTSNQNLIIDGFAPNATYTLSVIGTPNSIKTETDGTLITVYVTYTDSTLVNVPLITTSNCGENGVAKTFTAKLGEEGRTISKLSLNKTSRWTGGTITLNNLQVEIGDTATEYEPFTGSDRYTPNEKGVVDGVSSLYPTTVLFATTDGAEITCEYTNNNSTNQIVEATQKWTGKKWVCVGDSITMKLSSDNPNCSTDTHYYEYITDDTGIYAYNKGVGGTGYYNANNNSTFAQRIAADDFPTDVDVVTIFGGGNDTGILQTFYKVDYADGVYTKTTETISSVSGTKVTTIVDNETVNVKTSTNEQVYSYSEDETTKYYCIINNFDNIGTVANAIARYKTIFNANDDEQIAEPTTFCDYVVDAICAVHKKMPTVPLGIITPTPFRDYPPYTDNFISKISEAIVEICRLMSIPCLDLFHCSGLRPWDKDFRNLVYNKDGISESGANAGERKGVHPNEIGHKIIATKIKAFLETLIM